MKIESWALKWRRDSDGCKDTSIVAVCLVAIFFVTSSDSGSLVVDAIAAGGDTYTTTAQRVFWCRSGRSRRGDAVAGRRPCCIAIGDHRHRPSASFRQPHLVPAIPDPIFSTIQLRSGGYRRAFFRLEAHTTLQGCPGYLEAPDFDVDETETFTGWTVGGGLEHAFTDNWTGRLEYRYADYGREDFGLGLGDFRLKEHSIRAGVSFKF